jgi:predicted DNA-binding transcriptional regulator AlpA
MGDEAEVPSQMHRFMNRRQLRDRIPVSDMTIWRWMKAGIFPKPIKINGRNYWRSNEIDSFLEEGH